MRAVMVMFDSLNRHFLPNYGNDSVYMPNFERLEELTITFDKSYVASLPCIPARRELHTGRYNFMHRSWGPLEPYDDSMPQLLSQAGCHTHLVTDHVHYWEDGGSTYHNRYSSYEFVRGQEGDKWKGSVKPMDRPNVLGRWQKQDSINREYTNTDATAPMTATFDLGLDFMKRNVKDDNWFLQIETFDPHEPFVSPDSYLEQYEKTYDGPQFDWPEYRRTNETPEQIEHVRNKYRALLSMCDKNLGRVLDTFDEYNMWENTMLIVNTDHGFLLGEHGWWAKCVQPFYDEVSHTPLFIWDPRSAKRNEHRQALVQTIDLAPTLLSFFNQPCPPDMMGKDLAPVIASDERIRDKLFFGMFGGHINCLWGDYVYMKAPKLAQDKPNLLYNYTLMPMHMRSMFSLDELKQGEYGTTFSFTKGCPLLRFPGAFGAPGGEATEPLETMLFNLAQDPEQLHPFRDEKLEEQMDGFIKDMMLENDAPKELFTLFGLDEDL